MKKRIPFKIELEGEGDSNVEEHLLIIVKVVRAIAHDLAITIKYPAVITLEDLPAEEKQK